MSAAPVIDVSTMLLTEAVTLHQEILQAANRSPHTLAQYTYVEEMFVSWIGADADLEALTVSTVRRYLAWLQNRPAKPKTVRTHAAVLKCWSRLLADEGVLEDDPLRRLKLPKVPKRLPHVFSPEQFRSLVDAADKSRMGLRNIAMLMFMADTGARVSEVASLLLESVDMQRHTAVVFGKGSKERVIRFGTLTEQMLRRYLDQGHGGTSPYLFVGQDGAPLTRNGIYRQFQRLGLIAKISGVRVSPHTARSSFATTFARIHPGAILQLQGAPGHTSLGQTLEYIRFAEMTGNGERASIAEEMLATGGAR